MYRSAAPLWPLPALIALVLVVVTHAAWLLSVRAGTIPFCVPYIEGCTSISRAAREGLANAVFRMGVLPLTTAIGLHWWLSARWLAAAGADARTVRVAGLVAAGALAVYATFLGTDGEAYRFLRRYGVVVFFGASFLAQVAFLRALGGRQALPGAGGTPRLLQAVCAGMLAIGVAHVVALSAAGGSAFQDRFENALEWLLGAGLVAWYLAHARLWRQTGFGMALARCAGPGG